MGAASGPQRPQGGRAPFCLETLITGPVQEASVSRSRQILLPPSTAQTFHVPPGRSRPQGAPRPEAQGLQLQSHSGGPGNRPGSNDPWGLSSGSSGSLGSLVASAQQLRPQEGTGP